MESGTRFERLRAYLRLVARFLALFVVLAFLLWFIADGPLASIAKDIYWDRFIPDLIVGMLTASVVGVALWLAQRAVSRTELRAQAHRDWSAAQERLVLILLNHNFRRVVDQLAELGPIAGLSDIVDGLPVAVEAEATKAPTSATSAQFRGFLWSG